MGQGRFVISRSSVQFRPPAPSENQGFSAESCASSRVSRQVSRQGTAAAFWRPTFTAAGHRQVADELAAARCVAARAASRAFDAALTLGTDAALEHAAELLELRARLVARLGAS